MFLWGATVSIVFLGCSPKVPALPPTVTIERQSIPSRSSPVLDTKCSRCHDLGRVYAVVGSSGDWVKTVVVMSSKEEGWISAQEMENLATCTFEVSETHTGREIPTVPETLLPPRVVLERKCSHCHDLGRVYAVIDDPVQWVKTVVTMSDKDREWISGDAMKAAIRYRQRHPDYVQRLFDDTCGACHRWDELRAMKKTVSQWRTTIKYMARRCNEGMQNHEQEALYYALAVL
jgi:cytochrome c5